MTICAKPDHAALAAYHAELALQRANDALCKQFADAADPFSRWIVEQKEAVTTSKASLEGQLANVNGRITSLDADGATLATIKALNSQMEAANITNNLHTTLTAIDVQVQWAQFAAFLSRKKKMLESEIERQALRGITPAQFAEIEVSFRKFDRDSSGKIDKKELKACLYSLGEERNRGGIEAILKEYGDGKAIPYAGFKEFMINLLGVSVSKENILNSFKLINRGAERIATAEWLDLYMPEPDFVFFKVEAPATDGGWDYVTWTDVIFSR